MAEPPTTKPLHEAIRTDSIDPFRFEAFLKVWNSYFEGNGPDTTSDLEDVANSALQRIAVDSEGDIVGPQVRRMLNAFPNAAFVVRRDGLIIGQNGAGVESTHIDPGDNINALPFALIGGNSLSTTVAVAFEQRDVAGDVQFFRAVTVPDDRSVSIALVLAKDGPSNEPSALVFVIDPHWQAEAGTLLAQTFQLTLAETEILLAFMHGDNLPNIAHARNRSLATVRTQLHTIMSKAGVSTQAELMRNALALSQFQADIQSVAEVARHPRRKRVNLLGDCGRTIEVILAGDMRGDLVIFIPDTTLYTFHAEMEAKFAAAGLCVATLPRPGFGGTDPSPLADYEAAIAADVTTLQNQMKRNTAVLVGHSTSTGYAYRLGGLLGGQISRIVLLSTLVPFPYLESEKTFAPWAAALMRGAKSSPRLFRLMVAAGIKAWKVMGSRRFVTMQLAANEHDTKLATSKENLEEIGSAMRACSAQGIDHASKDLVIATSDWRNWVDDCKVPVELLHGELDPVAPIDGVRRFAADYPDKITLNEVPNAGFMLYMSHVDLLIERLRA